VTHRDWQGLSATITQQLFIRSWKLKMTKSIVITWVVVMHSMLIPLTVIAQSPGMATNSGSDEKSTKGLLAIGELGVGIGPAASTFTFLLPLEVIAQVHYDISYLRLGASYWNGLAKQIGRGHTDHNASIIIGPRYIWIDQRGAAKSTVDFSTSILAKIGYTRAAYDSLTDYGGSLVEWLVAGPAISFDTTWWKWSPVGIFVSFQMGAAFRICDLGSRYLVMEQEKNWLKENGYYFEYAMIAGVALF